MIQKIKVPGRQATPAAFARGPTVNVEPRVFRAPVVGWGRTEVMVPTNEYTYTNAFGRSSSLPRYVPGGVLELSRPSFSTLALRGGSTYPDVELDRVASESWDVNSESDVSGSAVTSDDLVGLDELMARAEAYAEKARIRESKTRDPSTVHADQSGLHAFEGFEADPDPCAYGDIRTCECCRCPECNAAGIRARKTKEPTFACNNPACKSEFDEPVVEPDRGE